MPFDWRRLIYMRTGWRIRRKKLFSNRSKQKRNRGVMILARAVVVRNLSSAACIKRSNWVSALILAPNKNLITPLLVTSLPQSKIARQSQQYHRETPPPAPDDHLSPGNPPEDCASCFASQQRRDNQCQYRQCHTGVTQRHHKSSWIKQCKRQWRQKGNCTSLQSSTNGI